MKYEMWSIDAWANENGTWEWNDKTRLESDIEFAEKDITPRKVFRWLRENGYIGEGKKYHGVARLEFFGDFDFEIQERKTYRPVYAFIASSESD